MANEFDYAKYLLLLKSHKRLFAAVALAVMTIAVIVSYVLPKKYQATTTVFIQKSVISDMVKGIAITPAVEDEVKAVAFALNNRSLLGEVIDKLDMNVPNEEKREALIREFQRNTDIRVKDRDGLFTILFTNDDPKIARDFVNTLVLSYIEMNLSSKREASYGATRFLSDQAAMIKEKMDNAESKVEGYKRNQGLVLATDESVIRQENMAAQQKLDELRIRRTQIESMRNIMKKSDPLRAHVAALQKRLDELRTQYTDSYPEVITVKSELETARQQMNIRGPSGAPMSVDPQELEKIEVELRGLRQAENFQNGIIGRNNALLRAIPAAKSNLKRLEDERDSQRGLYDALVNRQGQAEVSKQMEVQDKARSFKIIDPAVLPHSPISPNRVKIILTGIIAGLASAFGALICLDCFDPAIRGVNGIKELGLPVMAVIPHIMVEAEIQKERKSDMRLYRFVGCYFAVILFFLGVEALGYSIVDKVASTVLGM